MCVCYSCSLTLSRSHALSLFLVSAVWCKMSVFDLGTRIPLLMSAPWLKSSHGSKIQAFAEVMGRDCVPTDDPPLLRSPRPLKSGPTPALAQPAFSPTRCGCTLLCPTPASRPSTSSLLWRTSLGSLSRNPKDCRAKVWSRYCPRRPLARCTRWRSASSPAAGRTRPRSTGVRNVATSKIGRTHPRTCVRTSTPCLGRSNPPSLKLDSGAMRRLTRSRDM